MGMVTDHRFLRLEVTVQTWVKLGAEKSWKRSSSPTKRTTIVFAVAELLSRISSSAPHGEPIRGS